METKICSRCKKVLPATTECFTIDKNKKDGFTSACKECMGVKNKDIGQTIEENKILIVKGKKKCSKCK